MASSHKKTLIWCALVGTCAAFLYGFASLLGPFIAGVLCATLLRTPVTLLSRWMPRTLACLCVVLAVMAIIYWLCLAMYPFLLQQIETLAHVLPYAAITQTSFYRTYIAPLFTLFSTFNIQSDSLNTLCNEVQSLVTKTSDWALDWTVHTLGRMLVSLRMLASVASYCVIAPLVALYTLKYWDAFSRTFWWLLPPRVHPEVLNFLQTLHKGMTNYFKGQSQVCLTMALFYSTCFLCVGLPYPIRLGILMGLLLFIPYLGTLFGIALVLATALSAPGGSIASLAGAVLATGYTLETALVTPTLIGRTTGTHPMALLVAVFLFAGTLGIIGILFAMPLTILTKTILQVVISKYRASSFFRARARASATYKPPPHLPH